MLPCISISIQHDKIVKKSPIHNSSFGPFYKEGLDLNFLKKIIPWLGLIFTHTCNDQSGNVFSAIVKYTMTSKRGKKKPYQIFKWICL